MIKHVASIIKYNGDIVQALEWLKDLPLNYPTWRLKGIEKGDFLLWTSDYGLKIWKK